MGIESIVTNSDQVYFLYCSFGGCFFVFSSMTKLGFRTDHKYYYNKWELVLKLLLAAVVSEMRVMFFDAYIPQEGETITSAMYSAEVKQELRTLPGCNP